MNQSKIICHTITNNQLSIINQPPVASSSDDVAVDCIHTNWEMYTSMTYTFSHKDTSASGFKWTCIATALHHTTFN